MACRLSIHYDSEDQLFTSKVKCQNSFILVSSIGDYFVGFGDDSIGSFVGSV